MKAFTPSMAVYSPDADVQRRLHAYLSPLADVVLIEDLDRIDTALRQCGPSVLWVDLRARQSGEVLTHALEIHPENLVVGVGVAKSQPIRDAEELGVYAVQSIEADRHDVQALAGQALNHLQLLQENRRLKKEPVEKRPAGAATPAGSEPRVKIKDFSRAFRHFEDLDVLLDGIVEGIAGSMMVSRVGIFALVQGHSAYQLRAGLRCLHETRTLEYEAGHPLVQWLDIHAHLVSRSNIQHVLDTGERLMLTKALDAAGAEIIVPMHARGRIVGWLFVGHRSTGLPFTEPELEELLVAAEHSTALLENALLYEEVAIQKTLAETVLHSMPTGLVAVGTEGHVRWFNSASEEIFEEHAAKVLGQPIEVLGSRLANMLRRTLRDRTEQEVEEWTDPHTQRALATETKLLMDGRTCLGALALVMDRTQELALKEKEEQLERTSFWTELAASMSHEVRNPLVAIKTFAQLLPERYEDEEFRSEFSRLVSEEVDRLNKIIEQINDFAHPPELEFGTVNVPETLRKSLDLARLSMPQNGIKIDQDIAKDLPAIQGDPRALAECFTQLITNAMEASLRRKNPRISISAHRHPTGNGIPPRVEVSVRDNGEGIPEDLQPKVFSPFCTTKARGMGLGLPIVRRTVVDHNGHVDIHTNKRGTEVTISLPDPATTEAAVAGGNGGSNGSNGNGKQGRNGGAGSP